MFEGMSTAEAIYEKAKALPDQRQLEALHYVNFLLSQEKAQADSGEWAAFSESQLAKHYGPNDDVYDRE